MPGLKKKVWRKMSEDREEAPDEVLGGDPENHLHPQHPPVL